MKVFLFTSKNHFQRSYLRHQKTLTSLRSGCAWIRTNAQLTRIGVEENTVDFSPLVWYSRCVFAANWATLTFSETLSQQLLKRLALWNMNVQMDRSAVIAVSFLVHVSVAQELVWSTMTTACSGRDVEHVAALATITARSQVDCMLHCSMRTECWGASWRKDDNRCVLHIVWHCKDTNTHSEITMKKAVRMLLLLK